MPAQRVTEDVTLLFAVQIDGHGNFGSLDNDPAAAMRYTECRLRPLSSAMLLADLDYDTVQFVPNFDESQARSWCIMSVAQPSWWYFENHSTQAC